MTLNHYPQSSARTGFSLVEMLVVIAIIGILSAIIIPNIGQINQSANNTTDRRNAQSIASVFSAAQSAGLDFSEGLDDKAEIIAAVITGGTVAEGTLAGTVFRVPANMERNAKATEGAGKYLNWLNDERLLVFQFDDEEDES